MKWKCKLCGKTLEVSSERIELGVSVDDEKQRGELEEIRGRLARIMKILKKDEAELGPDAPQIKDMRKMFEMMALMNHLMLEHIEQYLELLKQNFESIRG